MKWVGTRNIFFFTWPKACFYKLSNKDETKYSNHKALSPSLLICCCIRKKRFHESLCSCQVGLLSIKFKLWQPNFHLLCSELCWNTRRYAFPIIFGQKSREYNSDINFSCSVNVFLFQSKAYRCSALFLHESETQESPQFSLGFPDREM